MTELVTLVAAVLAAVSSTLVAVLVMQNVLADRRQRRQLARIADQADQPLAGGQQLLGRRERRAQQQEREG